MGSQGDDRERIAIVKKSSSGGVAMVGIPVMFGEPVRPGAILTQLILLPANGGELKSINVRERVGTVIINN